MTSPFSESYFHGWRDGTAWKEELLGEGPTMTNLVSPPHRWNPSHGLAGTNPQFSKTRKTHAVRTSTELIKRALPERDGFSYPSAILAQSPSVFTGILDGPSLLEKGLDGSWNSQKLPAAGPGFLERIDLNGFRRSRPTALRLFKASSRQPLRSCLPVSEKRWRLE